MKFPELPEKQKLQLQAYVEYRMECQLYGAKPGDPVPTLFDLWQDGLHKHDDELRAEEHAAITNVKDLGKSIKLLRRLQTEQNEVYQALQKERRIWTRAILELQRSEKAQEDQDEL